MSLNMILIIMLIVLGIAYFSVRNARKQRERKSTK
jgi:hypothetical protein